MKRLKYYLLSMKPASETYEEMYEGKMYETFMDKDPIVHSHAMYWDGEIGYEVTKSNRLELSKPTVTIHIPMKQLKLEETGVAELDYIFRSFIPYIRNLNEGNDNRKRTDRENGHYYIYEPNNKVLVRNVISAKMVPQKYYRLLGRNTIEPVDGLRDRGLSTYAPGKSYIIQPEDEIKGIPAYQCVSIMIQVQLPVGKHKKAVQMLTHDLPEAVNWFVCEFDGEGLKRATVLYEKQEAVRRWLKENDCCAFVADGSILPREKDGDSPLQGAVPFLSTPEDAAEVAGVRGMVFRKGVTVITGGGYSGKSTLLDALSAGVYNHVEGDGRELVITDASAMKISAEDGRCVRHVNLSPFIKWIPGGNPADFSTEHASGSTSQAANIMEAVSWGAGLLMIDEDKSATNFMIQDSVMKELIEKEPITPFVERVRELALGKGVSTVLVIGGSSEYLQAADRIYMMRDYRITQVTEAAKALQAGYGYTRKNGEVPHRGKLPEDRENAEGMEHPENEKRPKPADFFNNDEIDANYLSICPEDSATEVLKVSELGFLMFGEEQIDIRMLHDIASLAQLSAIAFLVRRLIEQLNPLGRFQRFSLPGAVSQQEVSEAADMQSSGERGVPPRWICRKQEVERLLEEAGKEGLESVYSTFFTECGRWMDMPRKYEILAVLSRMRRTGG
ncbi:P-loop domain-containing protein [Acetatifactor muris]|uniref:P-loop domain-containing protein n=1 Tax=Acetatifactor muris TaxID=879566 RepID=UPI0023F11430|nr:P-loop domain-containing protein [Acetatifactor muris]